MVPIFLSREIRHLQKSLPKAQAILQWPEPILYGVDSDISLWCPAQQLHHAALVMASISDIAMKLYQDEDPGIVRRGWPTTTGFAVLLFGHIPRGGAQSPSEFLSPPEVTRPEVEAAWHSLEKKLEHLEARARYLYDLRGRWPHPLLGPFTAPQWIRFARVHTDHHLGLARDIGAALRRKPAPVP
jgi:hypothetical protein